MLIAILVIGGSISLRFLLSPIFSKPDSTPNALASVAASFSWTRRLLTFVAFPIITVIEYLQLVSSFKRTLYVSWPPLFSNIMARLEVLNLSFLQQRSVACLNPSYKSDYTAIVWNLAFGVTAALAYIAVVWVIGRIILRVRQSDAEAIAHFNRTTLSRVVLLLTLVYTPICSTILVVFKCENIGEYGWFFLSFCRLILRSCNVSRH